MTPGRLSRRVIADRLEWIERMLAALRTLPLESEQAFFADPHNVAAADLVADPLDIHVSCPYDDSRNAHGPRRSTRAPTQI